MSRIIAGALASRKYVTPSGTSTRPTTDRVRESVFGFLASHLGVADCDSAEQLSGLAFLDLYAGSGGVGLEAYSRGAEVTWVDKATSGVLTKNLQSLSAKGKVMACEVMKFLARPSTQFDIIWMDPPYEIPNADIEVILTKIIERNWLKSAGIVLVERSGHSSRVEFSESFLNVGQRRYGDTMIYYAEKGP
ncbi:MAG: 16S rRNA (guanine(966)-N(2))-methyltransferase RsmD [Propionibacteriaceae bacterium]|nr:16S rRNA (guanine(966)-N(2))-methyltransferase RsmD [Propionibacteriaceae bacterium]